MAKEKTALEKVNEEVKSTTLKNDKTGKIIGDYVEVNQRVLAFRKLYPEGFIMTDMISNENGVCIFKAQIGYYAEDGSINWLSNGYAYEKEGSTFINKTSYIENCETSAVGRALGFLGIGIDANIASKEEVINTVVNQDQENKPTILATEKQCEVIKNKYAETVDVLKNILKQLGKNKIVELTIKEASDIISGKYDEDGNGWQKEQE